MRSKKYLKSPWIETIIMVSILVASYTAIAATAFGAEIPEEGMSRLNIFALLAGLTMISFVMAFFAAVSGVGGGVLFTPVMLAFTPVDSLIIRATGVIFAMFTGLTSTGPLMKRGLANLRMSIAMSAVYGTTAFAGAFGAIYIWKYMGEGGEAAVRISLGLIVFGVAIYMFFGGKKLEWPGEKNVDRFTAGLNFSQSYFENSLNKVVEYKIRRAGAGFIIIGFVGFIAGFFGMGGAWAVVLAQNVIMGAPLKVSAANSLAIIGMGNCIALWPYLLGGGVSPLFVAPWLVGVVMGGRAGSILLINIRAGLIRLFLIGILFFTGFSLVARGLDILGIVRMQGRINAVVFIIITLLVFRAALSDKKTGRDLDEA